MSVRGDNQRVIKLFGFHRLHVEMAEQRNFARRRVVDIVSRIDRHAIRITFPVAVGCFNSGFVLTCEVVGFAVANPADKLLEVVLALHELRKTTAPAIQDVTRRCVGPCRPQAE